ncbi:hypothetical protein B0T14DRAFT_135865 [Immersiella caudata]|uniref:Uncharacterized protein n=1 Tax=Immersiella caudata TaxID=314043 RepID=A0AA39X514_9PEZI|nr:hypothetical protein B0T14DRAFT_135865 [Immersiella caudata]
MVSIMSWAGASERQAPGSLQLFAGSSGFCWVLLLGTWPLHRVQQSHTSHRSTPVVVQKLTIKIATPISPFIVCIGVVSVGILNL